MKYLKMLACAAIASMALMAFGSGSASATTLRTSHAPKPLHKTASLTLAVQRQQQLVLSKN